MYAQRNSAKDPRAASRDSVSMPPLLLLLQLTILPLALEIRLPVWEKAQYPCSISAPDRFLFRDRKSANFHGRNNEVFSEIVHTRLHLTASFPSATSYVIAGVRTGLCLKGVTITGRREEWHDRDMRPLVLHARTDEVNIKVEMVMRWSNCIVSCMSKKILAAVCWKCRM